MSAAAAPRPLVVALQGVAVSLFCLGQLSVLLQPAQLDWVRPLDGLFRSGNVAVAVLLTCLGFTTTRRLLVARREGLRAPLRVVARFLVTVFGVLVPVDAAVLLIHRYDGSDATSWESTRSSVVNVLSLQWNSWIDAHPYLPRADLSSLWFFSVAAQLVCVLAALVLVAGRRPVVLLGIAVLFVVGVVVTRPAQVESQGWYSIALSTVGWSDAFFLGVVAAVLRRPMLSAARASAVAGAVCLVLVGAVVGSSFVSVTDVFAFVVPVAAAATSMLAHAAERDPDPRSLLVQLLSTPEVRRVGALWPYVLGWSSLVAITLSRHSSGEAPAVFLVGLGVVGVAVLSLGNERALAWVVERAGEVAGRARTRREEERSARMSS